MTAEVVEKTRGRKKLHTTAAGFHNISAGRIIPEFFQNHIFIFPKSCPGQPNVKSHGSAKSQSFNLTGRCSIKN